MCKTIFISLINQKFKDILIKNSFVVYCMTVTSIDLFCAQHLESGLCFTDSCMTFNMLMMKCRMVMVLKLTVGLTV